MTSTPLPPSLRAPSPPEPREQACTPASAQPAPTSPPCRDTTWHAAFDLPAQPLDRLRGPRKRGQFTQAPVQWLTAWQAHEVADVLDQAHALARAGHWIVGGLRYEAAAGLLPYPASTHPSAAGTPLAEFAVFDAPPTEWPAASHGTPSGIPVERCQPWAMSASSAWAEEAIETVRERIRRGEVYQINLTLPVRSTLAPGCSHADFFQALLDRQPGGFAFALRRGDQAWLSVSPELFFAWAPPEDLALPEPKDGRGQPGAMLAKASDTASHAASRATSYAASPPAPQAPSAAGSGASARPWRLATQPMKGTSARQLLPQADQAARQHLLDCAKERAENLMIVDLLRNDLSQVALTGSVDVPALFEIHALPTVWQMTSTVACLTDSALSLSSVFRALFPCGSITGAPKRAAMQLIHELEHGPRGLYCGAMGWIEPGGACLFNVPIRTVECDGGALKAGVGSGITLDAEPWPEWQEWLAKIRFLRQAEQLILPFDTARVESGAIWLRGLHHERLMRSMACFHPGEDLAALGLALDAHWDSRLGQLPAGHAPQRLRTEWHPASGWTSVMTGAPAPAVGEARLRIAPQSQAAPWWPELLTHKTQRREHLPPPPSGTALDWILHDAQGRLLEGSFGHLAVWRAGRWWTPRLSLGLLDGVLRRHLLNEGTLCECEAGDDLTLADLHPQARLAWFNSLRGWLPAVLDSQDAQATPRS